MSILKRGSAILRAPEGDPNGGGTPPPLFSDEQQQAIGQIVNAAVTSQLKRNLGPGIAEALKATKWEEILAPTITALAGTQPGATGGSEEEEQKPKGKKGSDAFEAQIQKLATELENERKARQAAEQARLDAEQKRLMDGATTQFRNALQPKLRPELLDVAVGHFGRDLKLGDDGSPLIRVKRAPYKGAPEEDADVPLSEGLSYLLGSEQIKPFLPAPGGGGTEPKRGGAPSRQSAGGGSSTASDPASKTLAELERAGLSIDDI